VTQKNNETQRDSRVLRAFVRLKQNAMDDDGAFLNENWTKNKYILANRIKIKTNRNKSFDFILHPEFQLCIVE